MERKPTQDELIKFVISSNLEQIKIHISGTPDLIKEFPLCGEWRKNITYMHLAAAYGSITCIQYFKDKIDINSQTDDKWTPLHCAAANAHNKAIEVLLDYGADPNLTTSLNQTAMHLAAKNGSSDVILSLLAAGVDADAKDSEGWNAIHYAASAKL